MSKTCFSTLVLKLLRPKWKIWSYILWFILLKVVHHLSTIASIRQIGNIFIFCLIVASRTVIRTKPPLNFNNTAIHPNNHLPELERTYISYVLRSWYKRCTNDPNRLFSNGKMGSVWWIESISFLGLCSPVSPDRLWKLKRGLDGIRWLFVHTNRKFDCLLKLSWLLTKKNLEFFLFYWNNLFSITYFFCNGNN